MRRIAFTTLLLAGMAAPLGAQSLQRLSLQGSGTLLSSKPDPSIGSASQTRAGWEGQLRITVSRFSLGFGYQRSTVFKGTVAAQSLTQTLSLGFVEPRLILGTSGGVAFYAAGRAGLGKLTCSTGPTDCPRDTKASFGGGGGLLFKVNQRIALDLGGQYFHSTGTGGAGYAMARAGLGIGL